jgi:hypothetical protein
VNGTLERGERPEARPFTGGRPAMHLGLGVGLAGAAMLALGGLADPAQALHSYLVAYAYLFALAVGAMAFLLSMDAAGAVWPAAVRRLAESLAALLPLLLALLVPILAGADLLYPWMHPAQLASEEARAAVLHRRPYMNLRLVVVRAAACFAFFVAVAFTLRRWSSRLDHPGAPAELAAIKARLRVLGSVALPALGVFGTLAAWDWLMSLSPRWYSTMFGLYYLAGGFVTALALISLLAVLARRAGHLPGLREPHLYALGRLLFAFTIFWAYTAYFQYTLSWIANRPLEAAWFLPRTSGLYGRVGLFLIFGTFGLPFLVLASYWIKRRAWGIAAVAGWIAAAHYFDVHWIVAAARARPNPFSWLDAAAAACVGGLGLAFGIWRQRGRPLAAVHDPAFEPALEYESR